jgi:serine/threonine-protein kinase
MDSGPRKSWDAVPPAPESSREVLPRQFGKYTLVRELAAGGMAKVYLALQRSVAGFEKLVVIKRVLPELARDHAFVEMLLSEARTAATLDHPNVVHTFDVGEVEGTYFIAMEYINGEDIRSIVRAMKRVNAREFPLEHALAIMMGVCSGLAYAHEKRDLEGNALGIIHRDISPQNILVTHTGDVKIVDFGIAKSTQAALGEKTAAGQLKGKVPYMSPEQARAQPIDHRSDIFAVGILLFELTTGRRLFKAPSDFETLKLICDRDYPLPSMVRPGYPAELERIVMRALAKKPDDRYQSARDMQADLEAFIRQERIAAGNVGLGKWMQMLFEDKLAQQKDALQDIKRLADVIAAQRSDPGDFYATGSHTPGAATTTVVSALPSTGKRNAIIAVAALAVIGAGAVFFLTRPRDGGAGAAEPPTATEAPLPSMPKRGSLVVKSEPEGAYVRLAGELQGSKTPATLERLPLGIDLEVKVSMEGFEDQVESIKLTEDKPKGEVSFKLVRGTVTVTFKVEPKDAAVYVDDKPWSGKDNRIEGLSAGEHKLTFSAPGHEPSVVKILAQRGETKNVELSLRKAEAKVATQASATPAAAGGSKGSGTVNVASKGGFCDNVIIAGRSVGPTPVAGISVPAGPVSIVCKLGDGRTVSSGTVVQDGQTARVTIPIPPK